MRQTRITDGTDRTQYGKLHASLSGFNALESDWKVLFDRLMDMSRGICFFNRDNQPDGYLRELWQNQLLPVLLEICLFDVKEEEKKYLHNRGTFLEKQQMLALFRKIEDWKERLTQYNGQHSVCREEQTPHPVTEITNRIIEKLEDRLVLSSILKSKDKLKKTGSRDTLLTAPPENDTLYSRLFYLFLMIVKKIQDNIEEYLETVTHNGDLDPSLAVFLSFVKHYGTITDRFNERWQELPSFYIRHILKSRCREARPDHTWLSLKKTPDATNVRVPAGTRFIAGENENGEMRYYATADDLYVTGAELKYALSIFKERSPLQYPAARMKEEDTDTSLSFVTAIKQKKLNLSRTGEPQDLFGNQGGNARYLPMGIMIESSTLLLREGIREGHVCFRLTSESQAYFENRFREARSEMFSQEEIEYKLLQDAFYLKISTVQGWLPLTGRLAYNPDDGNLYLHFRMEEDFPATAPCSDELHHMQTDMPVLRLIMNRTAWLYPYSWATRIRFSRLTIRIKVQNLTSLKIYGDNGTVDASTPFYPFGVQAKKNSWMVFGNYEMSVKPLRKITFACKWQQLPLDENGFAGHYREYGYPVDNRSFRVRTEWLNNRKWIASEGSVLLFRSDGNTAKVREESELPFVLPSILDGHYIKEEDYDYSTARNGFFRLVLDSPEIGFGHVLYRELFPRVMMENSRLKKKRALPQEPASPLMNDVKITYEAEDEFIVDASACQDIKIYHVLPLIDRQISQVRAGREIPFIQELQGTAHLFLGFAGMAGNDRLRFYMDFIPLIQNKAHSPNYFALPEITWYIYTGKQWMPLNENSIKKDSTEKFTNSGLVEIVLPEPVGKDWLDKEQVFWLRVSVGRYTEKCQLLRGIYINAVEAIAAGGDGEPLPAGTITEAEYGLPGIDSVEQFLAGSGGCPKENETARNIRISCRIAHRNRLVTPMDYERMTLTEFPEVEKVKCLPGSTKMTGTCTVTLIPMQKQPGGALPVCSYNLLNNIRNRLQPFTPPMVKIVVINPVYEEITVRCHFIPESGVILQETLTRLNAKMNKHIAPWKETGKMPVFGYTFPFASVYSIFSNDEGVKKIEQLSLLYTRENADGSYELKEYKINDVKKNGLLPLSYPWSILVPAQSHLITYLQPEETALGHAGINELSIGNTFIIPKEDDKSKP
ncbi:MAG: baseplate J/gp47 family protein [Parabacteroides sp.]|nr:baseplate J/gp47 family protein [Parabacteroides sp.]